MGNMSCGGKRIDPKDYSFSEEEIERIKKVFEEMSALESKTLARKTVGKKAFKSKLTENPNFGGKLYEWAKNINADRMLLNIENTVEALIKDHPQSFLAQYLEKGFDKFELFLQISLGKRADEKETLSRSSISYSQGLQFLEEVFNAFHLNDPQWQSDSGLAAKLVAVNVFKNEQVAIPWRDFVLYIRQALPYINDMVPVYIASKFIDYKIPFCLAELDSHSQIFNQEVLGLFYLSNPYFQQTKKLNLLYSYEKEKHFSHLSESIKGYDGPTLILIKHVTKSSTDQAGQTYVFGGFSKLPWKDDSKYFGNTESYLFTLIPKFQFYSASNPEAGTNYMYFNSEKKPDSRAKVGLGFGGKDCKGCRIWIDEDIEHGSYVNPSDSTYQKGDLIDPLAKSLNITQIEIWGLGSQVALQNQKDYRAKQMELSGMYGGNLRDNGVQTTAASTTTKVQETMNS